MSSTIKRIRSANIDGRARSQRYIQKQLADLHNVLTANATEIKNAIRADTSFTPTEAEIEFSLAVDLAKQQYEHFDFEQALKDEYAVARNEDVPDRRVAAGIVYVVPSTHTQLYSIVAPVAAAITAGNCVVVELENSLSTLSTLLRRILPNALDHDTFGIIDTRAPEDFLRRCIVVDSRSTPDTSIPSLLTLSSPAQDASSSRVIALVDRDSDVAAAARAIVRARTAFSGRSPYAPDLVLVNEWVLQQFTSAAVTEFTKHLSATMVAGIEAASGSANGSATASTARRKQKSGLSEQDLNEEGVTVVLGGDRGSVVAVSNRESSLLTRKFNAPVLILHPITSLDDAVDFANTSSTPLLSTYHFAPPATSKYTSQFISSRSHFVNHIPSSLLLGPAAPASHPLTPHPRYQHLMFTTPSPILISPPSLTKIAKTALHQYHLTPSAIELAAEVLLADEAAASSKDVKKAHAALETLRGKSKEGLAPTGQKEGKIIAFFDQGLMLGAGIVMTPVLAGIGAGVFFGVRAGLRRWR